ncbi:MAG: hypothetical protein HC934_01260 [Acaryochloridaceae cyanobacterium SU_2_1]|nr:hypothetical protein [Acaryochloridaceae cyanobacterium SU_2_1]
MPTAGSVSGHITFKLRIEEALQDVVQSDTDLEKVLETAGFFSVFYLAAVSVGTETGQLSKVLRTVCSLQEEIMEIRLESLTALLEPLILILLGFVTGTVAFAVILLMSQMIGTLTLDFGQKARRHDPFPLSAGVILAIPGQMSRQLSSLFSLFGSCSGSFDH